MSSTILFTECSTALGSGSLVRLPFTSGFLSPVPHVVAPVQSRMSSLRVVSNRFAAGTLAPLFCTKPGGLAPCRANERLFTRDRGFENTTWFFLDCGFGILILRYGKLQSALGRGALPAREFRGSCNWW